MNIFTYIKQTFTKTQREILTTLQCRVGLVVSVSASHTVGRGFASQSGHTKDHHENGTYCLP